jgi:hypothetical protein
MQFVDPQKTTAMSDDDNAKPHVTRIVILSLGWQVVSHEVRSTDLTMCDKSSFDNVISSRWNSKLDSKRYKMGEDTWNVNLQRM